MLMALNSRDWTELTEPCKCSSAEDEDVRWGRCDEELLKCLLGGRRGSANMRMHALAPAACNTHKQTQELLKAQVVWREARALYWCWVMLTTSPALWDRDESSGSDCHKRSHISVSHLLLYQFLQSLHRNNIEHHYKYFWQQFFPLSTFVLHISLVTLQKQHSSRRDNCIFLCVSRCVYDYARGQMCIVI